MGILMMKSNIKSQRQAVRPSRLFILWYLRQYCWSGAAVERGEIDSQAALNVTRKHQAANGGEIKESCPASDL